MILLRASTLRAYSMSFRVIWPICIANARTGAERTTRHCTLAPFRGQYFGSAWRGDKSSGTIVATICSRFAMLSSARERERRRDSRERFNRSASRCLECPKAGIFARFSRASCSYEMSGICFPNRVIFTLHRCSAQNCIDVSIDYRLAKDKRWSTERVTGNLND